MAREEMAAVRGMCDALTESAKQHRLTGDTAHARMCDAQAAIGEITLRGAPPYEPFWDDSEYGIDSGDNPMVTEVLDASCPT